MSALRVASVLVALTFTPAVRADFIAMTTLTGSQETPPTGSPGMGGATVSFTAAANTLSYAVTFTGLTAAATAAHIHVGPPGVAGPIILPFTAPGPPAAPSGAFAGTLTAADLMPSPANGITTFADAINAIQAGNTYVNIHTGTFPNGEIRGQLVVTAGAVPAPGALVLAGTGALTGLGYGWRRRRAAA